MAHTEWRLVRLVRLDTVQADRPHPAGQAYRTRVHHIRRGRRCANQHIQTNSMTITTT
jgi:hypothetical protein